MALDGTLSSVTAALESRLEVPGITGFEVVSVRVREGLSDRVQAEVEVVSHEDLEWDVALLQQCKLSIEKIEEGTHASLGGRTWTLMFGEGRFVEHKDSGFRYVLALWDPLWPLGLGLGTRKYRNMTTRDIVSLLLDEAKVPYAWRLSSELPVRKYTAQYRESNLAFISRLLEFDGIYYSFEADGTVSFGDASPSAERLRDGRPYELIETQSPRGEVGLHVIRRGKRVTTGKVTVGDYSFKNPDVPLCSSAEGESDRFLERYVYPAGFREPEQGARLAKLRIEAYRASAAFLEGKGNEPAFAPGVGFTLGGGAAATFSGDYLLVRIEHATKSGIHTDATSQKESSKYENRFSAIPIDLPFRPLPETPRPTVQGVHTAMVRGPAGEEIHTDKYGRFRAQMHWDREGKGTDDDSRWMRYMQETTSSMTLARVGWEVVLGYIDGDPDRPVGLGRSVNGEMMPTYGQPANKTMMSMKTPSSPATGGFNEIKMDDAAGGQHISIQAEKDYDALIKNDKSETVGENETHTVTNDFKRHIQGNQYVTIGANDSASYEASSELKVKGNRSISVGGSETVNIGGGQKQTVTKNDSEKVGVLRFNLVGSLKMPDFKAMAKSALSGLNPIKGLQGGLKNPFKDLLPSIEKKLQDTEKALLDKIKGLPDQVQKDLLKELEKQGTTVLKDAYDAAKKAFEDKGLGSAVGTGVNTALDEAGTTIDKLPTTVESSVEQTVKNTIDGLKKDVTGLVDYVKGLPEQLQGTAANYVKSILPDFGQAMPEKFDGLGGFLPSVDQLKSMYSADALEKGLTTKLEGALNTATGGLYDSFFPKGENGQREFTIGWDQIDKLIDMFTTGGISKTAVNTIKVLVGAVTIKAAIGPISWGSKIVWMETVGGVKYTRTPVKVDQDVTGKMQLTVLGQVERNAGTEIVIRSEGTTSIDVGVKSTWEITETIEITGKTQVVVEATSELTIKGAGSSITLTPGAAKLSGAKLGIPKAASVLLKGNVLQLTK